MSGGPSVPVPEPGDGPWLSREEIVAREHQDRIREIERRERMIEERCRQAEERWRVAHPWAGDPLLCALVPVPILHGPPYPAFLWKPRD